MTMELEEVQELLANKRFNELKNKLKEMKSADISVILDELEKEDAVIVFRLLSKEKAGMTFSYMESNVREKLIQSFTDKELKSILDELFMDDTVDLIEEMPSNIVPKILKAISKEDRKIINELLKYPDDSAGSIMTTEFIDFKENMTIEQALDRVREIGTDSETIYTCYVLDNHRVLQGIVSVRELVLAKEESLISDIMETNIISINVLQDEVEEDFNKMAAMTPNEDGYFETSVFQHVKNRIVWLLVLMLSSIVTGTIITNYEKAFSAIPLLVAFIPMIMDTGGNCGSQSSTLIIRGLATDELELKDVFKILWKEIRIAVIVGVILSIVNGLRIFVQYKNLQLTVTVRIKYSCYCYTIKINWLLIAIICKKIKIRSSNYGSSSYYYNS